MPGTVPVRQSSILLPVPPNPNSNSRNDARIVSALNNAIDVVNIVHDLLPLEPGRGVLSTISSILVIVKNTIANQDDFAELADQCNRIGLVIWRATCREPKEMNPSIQQALSELKRSVDGILEAVEKKSKKGLGSKVFHVKINQGLIVQWQQELDRFLTLFNTELSIVANSKLDELLASFEEFRSNLKTRTEEPIAEALPAKPPIFLGRDDLVKDAVKSLLTFHHVALIGPGGMGKTSIARAVVNDDAISNKFPERRYFVRYDDMDASQITYATFLDRIARALGISLSKANTHSLISNALSTSDILLVLDNAETFLDAEKDAGRIAESIDQFGARANVSIMLTTRTTGLPPNLSWERLRVPALEESAACAAFRMIYHPPIDSAILCKLLSSIDFHPLSINLLAQVGVQNEWSSEELVSAWDRQHALLLENGSGKIHSIAITVELSLNSPSLKKLGETVRHLLQVIAFLPQGISKTRLGAIFPSNLLITQCAELLCKHSLAYHKGDFITMLAPIRLYISTQYNSSPDRIPLLSGVLAYYNDQLGIDPVDKGLIRAEDVNIEHVVALGLSRSTERTMAQALNLTTCFLSSLTDYKPHPTALLPVVSVLRPEESIPTSSSCLNVLKRGDKTALIEKGTCINQIAVLALEIGQLGEAKELFDQARDLFIACGSAGRFWLRIAYIGIGGVCATLGDFVGAEAAFEASLRTRPYLLFKSQTDRHLEAYIKHCRGAIKMVRGDPGAVDLCLAGLKLMQDVEDFQGIMRSRLAAGYSELVQEKNESAMRYFQAALDGSTEEKQSELHITALTGMAEVLYRQGHLTESKAFHQQVRDIIQESPDADIYPYAAEALSIMAAYTAMDGNIKQGRTQISALTAKMSQSPNIDMMTVNCFYIAACIELRDNDLRRAAELFLQTTEYCKVVSEVRFQARALRALGEIALLEKDVAAAKARFEEASALCDFMGVKPKFLYADHACYLLSEDLEGWTLFQQGRFPTV